MKIKRKANSKLTLKKEPVKTHFLSEAQKIMEKQDNLNLSLRILAKNLNMSAMALYRHYPSKEALFADLATKGFLEFEAAMRASSLKNNYKLQDLLEMMMTTYLKFSIKKPVLFKLMFRYQFNDVELYPDLQIAGEKAYLSLYEFVEASMKSKKILSNYKVEVITTAIWSFIHGLATLHLDKVPKVHLNEKSLRIWTDPFSKIITAGLQNNI